MPASAPQLPALAARRLPLLLGLLAGLSLSSAGGPAAGGDAIRVLDGGPHK